MRLFFAVEVGPPAADILRRALEDLRGSGADVRWVRTESFHLTLAFLGQHPPERAAPALAAARRALERVAPVRADLTHLGVFPSWKRPRVVWVGLGKGAEELTQAAEALRRELEAERFEMEKRDFRPHATLGRVRSGRRLSELRARAQRWQSETAWTGANFEVRELAFFESTLSSAGPRYEAIERIPLAAPESQ